MPNNLAQTVGPGEKFKLTNLKEGKHPNLATKTYLLWGKKLIQLLSFWRETS